MLVFVSAPALSRVLLLAAYGHASAPSCGPEFFEQCYVFRIPTHGRCYTPNANYRLVDARIARSGAAAMGLQRAANLVGGTPDVNRDT